MFPWQKIQDRICFIRACLINPPKYHSQFGNAIAMFTPSSFIIAGHLTNIFNYLILEGGHHLPNVLDVVSKSVHGWHFHTSCSWTFLRMLGLETFEGWPDQMKSCDLWYIWSEWWHVYFWNYIFEKLFF